MARNTRICWSVIMFATGICTAYAAWYYWPQARSVIKFVNPIVWITLAAFGMFLASIPFSQYVLVPILKRIPYLRRVVTQPNPPTPANIPLSTPKNIDRLLAAEEKTDRAMERIDSSLATTKVH